MCKSDNFKYFLGIILFIFGINITAASVDIGDWSRLAKEAEILEDTSSAEDIYLRAIEYHSSNAKQFLRAYMRLLNVYKKTGQSKKIVAVTDFLKSTYPDSSFDVNDEIKLANILIKYGESEKGYELKESIIARDVGPENIKAYIDASKSLIKHYGESDKTSEYFKKVNSIPQGMQDENDRYKIALLQLSNGDHDVGIANLEQIISLYPDSIQARKSVFVLAKYYRNEKQYDRAINYYNKYMSNYPEQEFFVQKSMQGILDCLISLGDVNLAEKTANSLADLVNGIADPRSVFDASENLFVKGQYQLANSTFLFGLSAANKFINNSHSEYERNLTRLHMIRSAYSLGKMEIANDASQAAIADLVAYMATPVNVTEKSDYLYSQILLWAAKIANDFEDYSKSRGFLEIFLHRYPDHKDTDYAKFQLVRIMMRRWEIDNIRITDISNRTHVHNKNLAFILQSGVLDTVKNLIQTINVVEFKKEAAQWTEYLQ